MKKARVENLSIQSLSIAYIVTTKGGKRKTKFFTGAFYEDFPSNFSPVRCTQICDEH
jgi:hypothetical protein